MRETSITQAMATPVATNASRSSPARARNADRNAPCMPDTPPASRSTPRQGHIGRRERQCAPARHPFDEHEHQQQRADQQLAT